MTIGCELLMSNVSRRILALVFACASVLLFSSQCHGLKSDKFRCRLTGACGCAFENDEGYNLTDLSWNKGVLNASVNDLTFYFQPCSNITIWNKTNTNECSTGATVCLYNKTSQSYKNLGLQHEVNVVSKGLNDPVAFVYTHNSSVTTIHLECADTTTLGVSSAVPNNYMLMLKSPSSCLQRVFTEPVDTDSHISTGAIFFILFVVFVGLYFIGGALLLKFFRGAEGHEMIPNYDFWVHLPSRIKDGFLYVIGGCQSSQAYDRI